MSLKVMKTVADGKRAYFASFPFLLMVKNVIVEVLLPQHEICTENFVDVYQP